MERVIYRVSLDVNKNGIQKTIQGFETGDVVAKELHITLRNGKENYELPSDNSVVATMKVTKPSGDGADLQPCTIDENGEIIYVVQPSDIEQMGTSIFQLELIGNVYRKDLLTGSNNSNVVDGVRRQRGVIVAPRFAIEVWESEYVSSSATTTYTFGMLEQALLEARSYYNHTFDHFEVDTDTYHIKICFKDGRTYENDQLNIIMDGIHDEAKDIEDIKLELSKKLNQIEPTVFGTLTVNGNIEPRGSIYANGEIKAQNVEAPTLLATNYASSPVIVTTLIDHPSSSGEISVQADTDFTDTLYYRTSANNKKSLKTLDTEVSNKVNKSNPSTTGNFYHSGNFNASGMITGDLYYEETSLDGGDFIPKPAQSVSGKFEALDSIDSTLTTKTTELDTRVTALEERPSGSASFTLESTSPLTASTNNNIVGLYAEGKSEQYISPNLFNKATITNGQRLNPQTDATSPTIKYGNDFFAEDGYYVSALIEVKEGKTYTRNAPILDAFHRVGYYDANRVCKQKELLNVVTIPSGIKYIAFCGITSEINTTMLVEGTTALPYEPYTGTPSPTNPIAIKDASGVVEAHTRNLVGEVTKNYSTAMYENTLIVTFPSIEKGKTYTISFDSNANSQLYSNENITNETRYDIAVGHNSIRYIVTKDLDKNNAKQYENGWRLLKQSNNSAVTLTNVMIEEGTNASEYVPYKSNAIDIVEDCGITLRSIGNIADTLTVNEDGSGEWVQRVGIPNLASLNWTYDSASRRFLANESTHKNTNRLTAMLCNNYSVKMNGEAYDANWDNVIYSGGENIAIHDRRFTSESQFIATLSDTVCYVELATPIVHTLTKEQVDAIRKLKTYEGTTLIDSELQNVKVKYQGDIKGYIDSKFDTLYALIRQYHPENGISLMSLEDEVVADE